MVLIMMVDGQIDRREMDYCIQMAGSLGFRPSAVNDVIDMILQKANKGVKKEKVKSEASEFLGGM